MKRIILRFVKRPGIMFLDNQQIKNLTNRKIASAQARQLDFMGIAYATRSDGSIVVTKSAVEEQFSTTIENKKNEENEPNWEAISNAKT